MGWDQIYQDMAFSPFKTEYARTRQLHDALVTLHSYMQGQARDYELLSKPGRFEAGRLDRRCAGLRHRWHAAFRAGTMTRHRCRQERHRAALEQRPDRRADQPSQDDQARHVRPSRRRTPEGADAADPHSRSPHDLRKSPINCQATNRPNDRFRQSAPCRPVAILMGRRCRFQWNKDVRRPKDADAFPWNGYLRTR